MGTPRYPQHGECTALGTYGEYDLYLCEQGGMPPTLVARYGALPWDYTSYNVHVLGEQALQKKNAGDNEVIMAFRTALARAREMGIHP